MTDVISHNQRAWDWQVEQNVRWTVPVTADQINSARSGHFDLLLTPNKPAPRSWYGCWQGKTVLGLASGGGQQGPLLAAAGAVVTIADLSPQQLAQDRKTCDHYGLTIATVPCAAHDLSVLRDGSFEMIVHPIANCFFENLEPVWRECHRVLKPAGQLLMAFNNPIAYTFDFDQANQGVFTMRYPTPYRDTTSLTPEERDRYLRPEAPLEFGHSLTDQLGGLMAAGFHLTGLYEDIWGNEAIDGFFPQFIAVRAIKVT